MTTVGGEKFHRPWSSGTCSKNELKSLNFDGRSLKGGKESRETATVFALFMIRVRPDGEQQ
jgi:hypothetical protein